MALKKVAVLVAGVILAVTLMLAVGTASASPGVDYSLSGSYAQSTICELAVCSNVYDYSASGSCQACTGFPPSAGVTMDFNGGASNTFPPSPCISKSVSGTFSITWSNATTSTGTLSGHTHDGKAYALSGIISAGAYTGGSISSLIYFPPNPCLAGSSPGTLTLYPPNPA
jgi:hypothetical protein